MLKHELKFLKNTNLPKCLEFKNAQDDGFMNFYYFLLSYFLFFYNFYSEKYVLLKRIKMYERNFRTKKIFNCTGSWVRNSNQRYIQMIKLASIPIKYNKL